jgi:AcrR family transcriptional regulator
LSSHNNIPLPDSIPSKGERTRQKVLVQAARLFATYGYDGVSMDRLAKALKLTKGALYTHFTNKYQIYLESTTAYLGGYSDSRPIAEPGKSPEANLEAYLDWLLTSIEKDKTYRLLLLRLFIDADMNTTRAIAECAMAQPVHHLTGLIEAYKPHINALEFVYSLATIAMLNPDLRKTLSVFAPDASEVRSKDALLSHMMALVRAA